MTVADLRRIVETVTIREAYGYQPTVVVQGMNLEQLREILLLAQSQLCSYEKFARENEPGT